MIFLKTAVVIPVYFVSSASLHVYKGGAKNDCKTKSDMGSSWCPEHGNGYRIKYSSRDTCSNVLDDGIGILIDCGNDDSDNAITKHYKEYRCAVVVEESWFSTIPPPDTIGEEVKKNAE